MAIFSHNFLPSLLVPGHVELSLHIGCISLSRVPMGWNVPTPGPVWGCSISDLIVITLCLWYVGRILANRLYLRSASSPHLSGGGGRHFRAVAARTRTRTRVTVGAVGGVKPEKIGQHGLWELWSLERVGCGTEQLGNGDNWARSAMRSQCRRGGRARQMKSCQ